MPLSVFTEPPKSPSLLLDCRKSCTPILSPVGCQNPTHFPFPAGLGDDDKEERRSRGWCRGGLWMPLRRGFPLSIPSPTTAGSAGTTFDACPICTIGGTEKQPGLLSVRGLQLHTTTPPPTPGLVADIDIESEKYRWMGSTRLDFYALLRIINLRKYHGRVYFVPAPGYERYGEPINHVERCNESKKKHASCEDNDARLERHGYQGPATCFKSSEWRFVEGPLISVWIHNVPWASNDAMAAPEAKFSDGYVDVVVIKDCPKSALLALLSKMNDGSYVKSPCIMYLKVKAFRLEPGQRVNDPSKGGIIDSDGEVIARGRGTYQYGGQGDPMVYGPVELIVHQGLATIFSPK